MLACARLGAIHTVVFGGFAANELAKRITDCKPSLIVSASCGLEANRVVKYKPLLDEALRVSEHAVQRCVVVQRHECKAELVKDRDVDWDEFYATGSSVPPVPVPSSHPLYILYTSGKPSAQPHLTGSASLASLTLVSPVCCLFSSTLRHNWSTERSRP